MKTALYIRVSTDEQAKEGYSIGAQHDRVTKFVQSQGWDVYDYYIDEGFSAKDLDRPAMQNLIRDAKENKFDVVVFYKLDRLVRSVMDLHELLQLFDEHNIAIRSTTEIFDTTSAIGRLFITIVAAMAQWERETIAERTVEGMTKKALSGERNGGKAPYGYIYTNSELQINTEEARNVREVFRMYLTGSGLREIVLRFNGMDKGPRDIRNVSRMLDNPVYCGKIRWNNNSKRDEILLNGNHPAIIDEETFNQVQIMRDKRRINGKASTSMFHFSGVLKCGRCGSSMSGWYRKQKDSKHYICIAKKNSRTCDMPIIREEELTKSFLASLNPQDPEKLYALLQMGEEISNSDVQDNSDTITEIEKELSRIKKRKSNWLDALGDGILSKEEYKEKAEEDTKKEKLLNEQLNTLKSTIKPRMDVMDILSMTKDIKQYWPKLNDQEKKNFIHDLFSKITVDAPNMKPGPGVKAPVDIISFELV